MTDKADTPEKRPHILIVDDDEFVLDVTQSRLLAAGRFHVTAHRSARSALVEISERLPDLVISDISMPGMDGGAFAATLRDRAPGLPIIFVSSLVSAAEAKAGRTIGGWPMLAKKTPFEDVLARIDDILTRAAGH